MQLLIIGFLLVVAIIAWAGYYLPKKRKEAFIKVVESLGLEPSFDLSQQDWERLLRFEFCKKHNKPQKVKYAVVAETDTTRVIVCEYSYVVDSGEHSSSKMSTILLVFDNRLQIPQFSLARKTWTSSLAKLVGYRFVEFPEDQAFNSFYLVRGEPEEPLREYLNPMRREALLNASLVAFEGRNDGFIVLYPDRWLQPTEIKARLGESLMVLRAVL